jgi:hypothetical protein
VSFAVFDSEASNVENIEKLRIPLAFATPDKLKYVRSNLLDILREYRIQRAGVRITEPNAQRPSFDRIQIEGVIQEAFASSELQSYFVGQISSIASKLGRNRTELLPLINGDRDYPGISGWSSMNPSTREALLCAMAAANA